MKKLAILFTVMATVLAVATSASAATIIKFELDTTGPDFTYSGGVLNTADDGIAGTTGQQNTGLEFVGFLDPLFTDIISGASLSLNGVTAVGAATTTGPLITQATTGGTFSIYDQANTLLLAGSLTDGAITGSSSTTTGSFFNTSVATYTAGSLLTHVLPTPAGISISFTALNSGGLGGLQVNGQNLLADFTADATGQVEGVQVPEPTSIALLLSGVAGLAARSRKRKATK